jgi:hypothetical protein
MPIEKKVFRDYIFEIGFTELEEGVGWVYNPEKGYVEPIVGYGLSKDGKTVCEVKTMRSKYSSRKGDFYPVDGTTILAKIVGHINQS